MRTFTVYRHPVKGYEAVKKGFSWPGFFFGWVWAFVKRLVAAGFVLLSVWLFAGELLRPREPNVIFFYFTITLTVNLHVGCRGNKWRGASLVARGYEHVGAVQAVSPDAAARRFIGNTDVEAVVDAVIKDLIGHIAVERGSGEPQRAA
jgi:hypothetical protein